MLSTLLSRLTLSVTSFLPADIISEDSFIDILIIEVNGVAKYLPKALNKLLIEISNPKNT